MIVGMHKAGAKGVEIAAEVGHPKTTISTVIKRFERFGAVEGEKSSGRPRKLSERSVRVVQRTLVADRRQTLADITNKSGFDAGCSTIRKALHEVGFYNRIAAKKPFLSDAHRRRRLGFASKHRNWTSEEWKNVIWTDESTFEVGKSSRQITVWRKSNERYKLDCLTPTFKSGRTSVMVWGAFTATHKLPLIAMPPGRRTAIDFVEIVYDGVLGPFLDAHEDASGLVLMEDGAPVHWSKAPATWRENHQIQKLEWPPNSPDLNPIENLWKVLKDRVQKRCRPKNQSEMWPGVEAEWMAIPQSRLESLVASMPERIKAVLHTRGGHTHW